jgi:YggT family protein
MSGDYFTQATIFLVELFFDIFIIALLLRYLLTKAHADSLNPLSGLIIKVTNPLLKPLRRKIPGYLGVDWSSVVALLLVQALEVTLVELIMSGEMLAFSGLIILTVAHLLKTILYIYLFIIIVQVIISWINPDAYNPITMIMYQLSEPILRPVRRIIPSAGGFDFSPLIILVIINLLMILLISPLMDVGHRLAH